MRTILLIRHGQSLSNAGGITMAHAQVPLTDLGRAQAADLAPRLPAHPARILSSPFVRALDTAQPYAERCGVAIEPQPLLHEFDMIDPALIAGLTQAERRPVAGRRLRSRRCAAAGVVRGLAEGAMHGR